jgi:hypothetical protein
MVSIGRIDTDEKTNRRGKSYFKQHVSIYMRLAYQTKSVSKGFIESAHKYLDAEYEFQEMQEY